MLNRSPRRLGVSAANRLFILVCWVLSCQPSSAADYFLTLGGGYNPSGNQASLEANVLFFQHLLSEKQLEPRRHEIYFADGSDPADDLQVLNEKQAGGDSPATDLLASLHRRRGRLDVTYRNHRVPEISGPLDPELIRAGLDALAKTAQRGDRLIVYVTAHGSAGPKDDPFNTTIDCWNERKITAREFSEWLARLPPDVPVVMVMAAYDEHRQGNRFQRRGGRRRGGGRRDLLREVSEKWPELGDARRWAESPLLNADNQQQLLADLKQLPGWKTYDERRQQMAALSHQAEQQELRLVKFRRLINALEAIVLERNLHLFASPEILDRYRQILALEESSLAAGG